MSSFSYLAAWHAMDDIWEKLQKKETNINSLSDQAKCFLLDCYHLWTKDTTEEQRFCITISSYKEEIGLVLKQVWRNYLSVADSFSDIF